MRIFPVLALVILAGCMRPVTDPESIQGAGPRPTQDHAEYLASLAVSSMNLLDLDAAKITRVTVGSVVTRPGMGTGWLISFLLNGKNAFGGYVGNQKYNIILQGNGNYRVMKADAWNP